MKLKSILVLAAIFAVTPFMAAGCAEMTDVKAKADAEEPVYRTGSNIADRQRINRDLGVQTMTGEEFERAKIPQMPQPRASGAH